MIQLLKIQSIVLVVYALSFTYIGTGCQRENDYHPFIFGYNNLSDKETFIKTVLVLGKDVSIGGLYPNTERRSSISLARNDCTPAALLDTTTSIVWWDRDFLDPDPARGHLAPTDDTQLHTCDLPFPKMDSEAYSWECQYTLQSNFTWVGQFYGALAKPPGKEVPLHNVSNINPEQPWLHVQFKNQTGKQVYFSKLESKLLVDDLETHLFLPLLPGDGKFQGFAAHSHKGSMYRPRKDSKIVFDWGHTGSEPKHEEFNLPEFSSEQKNWYCYFILGKDEKWTAVFEGVKDEKVDGDR